MKSPFTGVDPYLESQHYWPDFHFTFLNYWREAVGDALPPHYEARIDSRVQLLEVETDAGRSTMPDIAVMRRENGEPRPQRGSSAVSGQAVTMELPTFEEVRDSRIHILYRPNRTLVAVLELLSPTNKIGEGRSQYWAKRAELLRQPVHLVELDLLVGGDRLPMRRALPAGDYYAIIARSDQRRKAEVYSWTLRDRLPEIPIPLLKPDQDAVVDLGAVFATAYERGRFAQSIDYSARLRLPLSKTTRQWAESIAKGHKANA